MLGSCLLFLTVISCCLFVLPVCLLLVCLSGVLCRRYPTVERRAKSLAGGQYVAVPEDCGILHPLLTELGLTDPDKPFIVSRDDCARPQRSPALELHLEGRDGGALWPMLAIVQGGLILACLPLVEAPPEPRPPLPSLASVSQGLSLLTSLQSFLCGAGGKLEGETLASRLALLPSVLLQVCPLGTPLDTPQLGASPTAAAPTPVGTQKQPAWKMGLHRGRAVVSVALSEVVRSMQYGSRSRQDLWDVYGSVTCKVRLGAVELWTHTVVMMEPYKHSSFYWKLKNALLICKCKSLI